MTVKQMAAELGVTAMTIYRRLKRAGIAITELRDDVTNELTPDGVAVIGSLFDATEPVTDGATSTEQVTEQVTQPDTIAVLQARLDGVTALLQAVTDERDRLREQVDRLTELLAAQQRLLPAGHDGHRRRGLFGGWFRRRGSDE